MSGGARRGALADFFRRYAAVFRQAWRERHSLDVPPRQEHEVDFLPAALSLQDRPVSPAPRAAMGLIVGFAILALLWAIFGEIDIVATARGKIVPNDRTKIIQPIETAAVKAIRVTDGQRVKAGDVLLELDTTNAEADRERYAGDLAAARAQAARAKALLKALDTQRMPQLGAVLNVPAERLAQEQRFLEGQYAEYRARLARIDAEVARREAELRSTREVVRKLEQTAPIARQRAKDFKNLVDQNFVSQHGYLEKEQLRIEQEGDLAAQRSRLQELVAALAEGHEQRRGLVAETRRLALDSLDDAEKKIGVLAQELVKASSRSRLLTLTAPVEGTVQQLAVHTVGGVVTEAQALMVIVPRDEAVEVEAFVENKDIGFVNVGQRAAVKVETFPFTKYGTIEAEVTQVSNDAISDEKKGLLYSMRARLAQATIRVEEKSVLLSPGMAVTVEIKTGKRRVIEYFLSPLLQYGDESLRER
ncbi:MAG TPA: HlyD family type I secretion periplasmic adaptor subunit [Accumulibacter sp.]|jgi:hemolysin D|nr:HlyD family type I secretion periplasmic adaptor subunit [Accumulibacter sp.]HQC81344.1 HlyD family type I secretion periplasmic adaptor subunit [Accumulibacter sp.]